jgi:hypothetical protein
LRTSVTANWSASLTAHGILAPTLRQPYEPPGHGCIST